MRETKATREELKLRGAEWSKIQGGHAHFGALGVDFDHVSGAGEVWFQVCRFAFSIARRRAGAV
ncbi:MAG: hypothetical protein ACYC2R_05855 [Burkholderiales bacterium]